MTRLLQGRSDGGYIGIYTPKKSVTVLFMCGTLTHVLKLQLKRIPSFNQQRLDRNSNVATELRRASYIASPLHRQSAAAVQQRYTTREELTSNSVLRRYRVDVSNLSSSSSSSSFTVAAPGFFF